MGVVNRMIEIHVISIDSNYRKHLQTLDNPLEVFVLMYDGIEN